MRCQSVGRVLRVRVCTISAEAVALALGGCFLFPNLAKQAALLVMPRSDHAPLEITLYASSATYADGIIVSYQWSIEGALPMGGARRAYVQHAGHLCHRTDASRRRWRRDRRDGDRHRKAAQPGMDGVWEYRGRSTPWTFRPWTGGRSRWRRTLGASHRPTSSKRGMSPASTLPPQRIKRLPQPFGYRSGKRPCAPRIAV